jgi:hypothetical protein
MCGSLHELWCGTGWPLAKADGLFYLARFGGERMHGRGFIFVLAGLMACAGCERRVARAGLPNLVIPVGCASEITLVGCDARVSPPKCAGARVSYRVGCERILVGATAKGKP